MNWMKNMSLETLIQASLNLVKSYQQRLWPKASKYPNSPEKQGIYSDSRHAILNSDCFHWINSVRWRGKKALSVFYSQSQSGKEQHLSLSQRRVFSTLLTLWAPQCHWSWCGQTHPSPQVLHVASGGTVHHSDHLITTETKNLNLRHLTSLELFPWYPSSRISLTADNCNKMHEAKGNPRNFCFHYHPSQLGSNLHISPPSLPVLQSKGFKASSNISHCSSLNLLIDLLPRAAQQGQNWHHTIKLVPV